MNQINKLNINQIIVSGTLIEKPVTSEVAFGEGKVKIKKVSAIINFKMPQQENEMFITITAFNKIADILETYKIDDMIVINGKLKVWRESPEIIIQSIY